MKTYTPLNQFCVVYQNDMWSDKIWKMFKTLLSYQGKIIKKNTDRNSHLQVCHPNDNISRSISSGSSSALRARIYCSQGISSQTDGYRSRQADAVILGSSVSFSVP